MTGRVEAPEREPLPEVVVELHAALSHEVIARAALDDRESRPLRSVRTDAQGRFSLDVPAAGMWSLVFRAPGRLDRVLALEPLFESVTLSRVVLPSARTVSVTVRDPRGAPVAGALVMLTPRSEPAVLARGGEFTQPIARFARTDPSGVARLDVPASGRWDLDVAAAGFAPAALDDGSGSAAIVTLSAGQERALVAHRAGGVAVAGALLLVGSRDLPWGLTDEDGAIALTAPVAAPLLVHVAHDGPALGLARFEPATAGSSEPTPLVVTLETVPLAGTVLRAGDRQPLAGAWVWDAASPDSFVVTDAEGRYRLEASPVRAGAVRLGAAAANAFQEATQADPLLAARGEGPTFVLRLGARLTGLVVDGEGRPVPDAEVSRDSLEGGMRFGIPRRPVRTGADGRFAMSPVTADEPAKLRVRAQGYAPARVDVAAIAAGAEREVRVELAAGRRALGAVVDLADRPIAGASVTLTESIGGGGFQEMIERQLSGGGEEPLEATTDAEGRFALADLAPGRYDLEARAAGFAPARVPAVVVAQDATDTEIGTVALSPGVAIDGIVQDERGQPLEGVEIRQQVERGAFRVFTVADLERSPADATTGADGRFRLEDLAEGATVGVSAELAGYGPASVRGVRAPTEEPLLLVMKAATTLRGSVVDGVGEGVPHATLRLTAELGSGGLDVVAIRSMVRNERADEEGRFEIADVVPGRYELRAGGGGFQEARQGGIEVVAGRDPAEIRFVLEKGAVLRGQVLAEDGVPVAGAMVQRVEQRRSAFDFGSVPVAARTDADGRYRLDGLPPGATSISVDHAKHPKQVRDFVVQAGENLLDFRLESGREIAGRVVDETGLPVAGAAVSASAPTGGFSVSLGPGSGDPVTDERGEFTIEGLADGSYRVTASKTGYAQASTQELVRVEGRSVYGVELRLAVGAAITGQVLGLEFDELSQVQVIAMQPGSGINPALGQVDYEGSYRLDNLASGDWMVMATVGRGGKSVRANVTVEPGAAEVIVDLEFGGGLAIRGQVLRDGEPVRGTMVLASGRSTTSSSQSTTDQDGRFSLEGLDTDTYRLIVANLGSASSHEQEVELAGADAEVLIELRESTLSGRVVDARDGAGVAGARLSLTPVRGDDDDPLAVFGFGSAPESGGGGAFRLDGVSAGTWLLRAEKEGYATGTAQIEVAEGLDVDGLEIELEPARGVTLVVATDTGRPADEVQVVALDAAGRAVLQGRFSAGEGGVVRLDELPAGTWTLLVAPANGGATASLEVTAPGDDVAVRLPEAGGLRVRVPELEGTGLQATARLLDDAGRPHRAALFLQVTARWTLVDGVGQIPLVPVGTWTLEVGTADGTRTWRQIVRVVGGMTLEVVVD